MARAGEHHIALLVVERAHALAALRDDGRRGDALERHAAFLADRPQAVEKHLEANGIDRFHEKPLTIFSVPLSRFLRAAKCRRNPSAPPGAPWARARARKRASRECLRASDREAA